MSQFNCDVFVVPNRAKRAEFYAHYPEQWVDFIEGINNYWRRFGVDLGITEDTRLVQVWWTSADCENWQDHNHKVFGFVPGYLPLEMLDGMVDGDTRTIETNQGTIILTANQGDYRYRNFGSFDAVVRRVTQ